MPKPHPTIRIEIRIGVLDYPGAQRAAVHGLVDLIETAARLDAQARGAAPRLQAVICKPSDRASRTRLAALVLPPSLEDTPSAEMAVPLARWMRRLHARGTQLCSVCAGAFLLAETGLLDGRRATTHWALADEFARRFPRVRLDVGPLLIDEGDLFTAGGVMAWVDLGLRLIERHTSAATMQATARMFLVDPGAREQRFYSSPTLRVTHGDAIMLDVQNWLAREFSTSISVRAMAAHAALNERTFLRRFQAASGLAPTTYLQQLRVTRARELLEGTALSIEAVAWKVGYADTSAFRKIFQRAVGLSPGAYRQRFRPAAIRPRSAPALHR